MRFTKMHGLFNDYVFVHVATQPIAAPASLAVRISDRHGGIGSDGLILLGPSTRADARMEMYNADGSRGRMCGNGIRCAAKYLYERGIVRTPTMSIETDAGIKHATCHEHSGIVHSVTIDMGEPGLTPASLPALVSPQNMLRQPLTIDGLTIDVTLVSIGNPHAVYFQPDSTPLDLPRLGPLIEHHPLFPERINVHTVHVIDRHTASMQTWERGSGITRACGTGACAVAVAGVLTNRLDRNVLIHLPGGNLSIEWTATGNLLKTGPAVTVFDGQWHSH